MSGFIAGKIIGILVLVLFSAYFSATETAFASLNRTRLRTMAEDGNKKARLALSLSENYDKLLSTILIGNNIVNIAAASLGTILFVRLLGDMGATVSTIVLTVVVLIFGEITPKSAGQGQSRTLRHVLRALSAGADDGAYPGEFPVHPVEEAGEPGGKALRRLRACLRKS